MAVECTYCEEKFNSKRGVYVKCTACQDIKLCLECFSAGAEIAEHKSDHPYELVDCGSFPIIDESWKAHEELALLEAIELYGIGSWTDIANAVGTRSADECCERYLKVYVESFFGRCTWNAIDKNLYTVNDHTCMLDQPLSPSLSLPEREKIVDISREQQIRLGYMPKRDDFEREYDNDAELLVSRLAVNANDDTEQLDQDLKIAHINMYTDKLRERFRRKRIVLEYNLVKLFFHMHPEENVDCGLQMVDSSHQQSNTLHHNNRLFESTSMSTNTTAVGTTTSNNDNLNHTASNHDEPMTTRTTTPSTKQQAPETPTSKGNFESPSKPGQNTILNYFRRVDPPSRRNSSDSAENSILSSYFSDLNKSIAEQEFNTMEKKLRIFCQFGSAEDHNLLVRNLAREKEVKARIKELMEKKRNSSTSTTPNKSTNDSCWRLLSESEKRLCRSSNLKAAQYLSLKAAIIRDCKDQKRKKGTVHKLAADGNIDKSVRRKIFNFLTRNNWIKV